MYDIAVFILEIIVLLIIYTYRKLCIQLLNKVVYCMLKLSVLPKFLDIIKIIFNATLWGQIFKSSINKIVWNWLESSILNKFDLNPFSYKKI